MLFNKVCYGKQGAYKHYIGYLHGGLRPLYIIINEIKLYTDYMNISVNSNEFSKYIEMWNKIKDLFNEKFNKRGLYNKPVYNNEYIRTEISPFNENFHGNKKLTKKEYCGNSVL